MLGETSKTCRQMQLDGRPANCYLLITSWIQANPPWNDIELLVSDNLQLVREESNSQVPAGDTRIDDVTPCLFYQQFHPAIAWQRSKPTSACWCMNRLRGRTGLITDFKLHGKKPGKQMATSEHNPQITLKKNSSEKEKKKVETSRIGRTQRSVNGEWKHARQNPCWQIRLGSGTK